MSWQWEEMTAPEFAQAVQTAQGVCVLPVGVMEKHGDHLPLGTDSFFVETVAARAAEKEPAVVFPRYYFGAIHEAKHFPGTLAIRSNLLLELLDNVCDEIARNGLTKIILLNGHGGNEKLLNHFAQSLLDRERDFTLYLVRLSDYLGGALNSPEWKAKMVSEFDHHAGEAETSWIMSLRPELVKMEQMADNGMRQPRLQQLPQLFTPVWWYAAFPNHYAGDATHATAEKGEFLLDRLVDTVAAIIKGVKEDEVTPALTREFFSRIRH